MKRFDTHVHLTDRRFDSDRQAVIDAFEENGILGVIEAATDVGNAKEAVKLAESNARVYAAAGVHPHEAKDAPDGFAESLAELANHPKAVAIGEIGLDYHYDFSPRNVQQNVFRQQLALARALEMPVIIHSREATPDMLAILSDFAPVRGVMHCFSGSAETAELLLKMGLYISFTGTLTFDNARKVQDAFMAVPLDRVMAETDCPYLAPVPMRGKRNEPAFVGYVIEKMAALKNLSPEEMTNINTDNAKALFGVLEESHDQK